METINNNILKERIEKGKNSNIKGVRRVAEIMEKIMRFNKK